MLKLGNVGSILPSGLSTLERGYLLTLIGKVEDVTVMLAELNK
ncbi:hypothetical protein [Mycoplasmopsis bovis]